MDLPTARIENLEAFAVGHWNGDEYSEQDLDDMVTAFKRLKNRWLPFLKAGHESGQENPHVSGGVFGAPSLGSIVNVWRDGKKLLVNVKAVPRKFADLIKAGAYRRVSAEIFWDYEDEQTGKVYPKVLKALAFLGANIPAVTSLDEIVDLYARQFRSNATVKVYSFEPTTMRHRWNYNQNQNQEYKTMNLKTYSSETDMVHDFLAYSAVNGDRIAGARIQKEVDSGTPLQEIAQAARRFQRGEAFSVARKRAATPREVYESGISLHDDAVSILQSRGLEHSPENYRKCFAEAQERAPGAASIYNRGVKFADTENNIQDTVAPFDVQLDQKLNGWTLEDGTPDLDTMADVGDQFVEREIIEGAAELALQREIDRYVSANGVPDRQQPGVMEQLRREVLESLPALEALLDGEPLTADALRDIYLKYR